MIKGHIDNHNQNMKYYEDNETRLKSEGHEVPERPPWAKDKINFKFEQIKEKFASLRIYSSGADDEISGYIDFAELLSAYTCERCGRNDHTIGRTNRGWIKTICRECTEKDKENLIECGEWDEYAHNEEYRKLFAEVDEYNKKNEGKEVQLAMERLREISKRNETSSC
jgi:hypothetical protein